MSGKLPEAASPDRIVQTQKMGRPAVTGVGEMTHQPGSVVQVAMEAVRMTYIPSYRPSELPAALQ